MFISSIEILNKSDAGRLLIISSDKTLIGKVKGFSHGDSGIEASSLRGGNLVMTIDYRIQFFIESADWR